MEVTSSFVRVNVGDRQQERPHPPDGGGDNDKNLSAGGFTRSAAWIRLNGSGILEKYPNLSAYVARGEARPAYKRAFDDQLAVFTGKPPTG